MALTNFAKPVNLQALIFEASFDNAIENLILYSRHRCPEEDAHFKSILMGL